MDARGEEALFPDDARLPSSARCRHVYHDGPVPGRNLHAGPRPAVHATVPAPGAIVPHDQRVGSGRGRRHAYLDPTVLDPDVARPGTFRQPASSEGRKVPCLHRALEQQFGRRGLRGALGGRSPTSRSCGGWRSGLSRAGSHLGHRDRLKRVSRGLRKRGVGKENEGGAKATRQQPSHLVPLSHPRKFPIAG